MRVVESLRRTLKCARITSLRAPVRARIGTGSRMYGVWVDTDAQRFCAFANAVQSVTIIRHMRRGFAEFRRAFKALSERTPKRAATLSTVRSADVDQTT